MLTLKERKADRRKRAEEARAQSEQPNTGNDRVGAVFTQAAAAEAAINELSEAERKELSARLRNDGEPTEGYREPGTFPLAGIGVTNPLYAEMAGEQAGDGAGVGWGAGNTSDTTADETVNADGSPLTKKELMAILDSREPPVKYESDANHARLVELVKAPATPEA